MSEQPVLLNMVSRDLATPTTHAFPIVGGGAIKDALRGYFGFYSEQHRVFVCSQCGALYIYVHNALTMAKAHSIDSIIVP